VKSLCFLIEHDRPSRPSQLPLEARLSERLRFTAHFWCTDPGSHTLHVITHLPEDGGRQTLATIEESCDRVPGVLVFRGLLHPLAPAGWHRLSMDLDGEEIGFARQICVTGPRAQRVARYMGRGEPASSERDRPSDARREPARPAAEGSRRR
jgi:hypothetical protein